MDGVNGRLDITGKMKKISELVYIAIETNIYRKKG